MTGLLHPGAHRAAGVSDDAAVASALLRVEAAWAEVLATIGLVTDEQAAVVARAATTIEVDFAALAASTEDAGNPVVPLVARLREAVASVDESALPAVHRGLTSQDVLDTALMLLTRDAAAGTRSNLIAAGTAVADLARDHRDAVMAGRTLTQWAVPTTFGLKAAQWLAGLTQAVRRIDALEFPVQYGGAAGTRALLASLTAPDPCDVAAEMFAAALQLGPARLPWHSRRHAVTAAGDAFTTVTDALGAIAGDVLLLGRPEIAEVHEGVVRGRGGSSTMPHKQNPVLAVLVSAASQQAPLLAAQLHLAAAGTVDERPPGAWHAEWPALARLLQLVVTAASQAAELVTGLEVDTDAMTSRAEFAASALLAERGSDEAGDVRGYLGEAGALVDAALADWEALDE